MQLCKDPPKTETSQTHLKIDDVNSKGQCKILNSATPKNAQLETLQIDRKRNLPFSLNDLM